MSKSSKTFLLFANPSFLEGLARIFDFGNSLPNYNISKTAKMADYLALKRDWDALGDDFEESFRIVKKFLNGKKPVTENTI